MRAGFIMLIIYVFSGRLLFAQVGINEDNGEPDPSAVLDVKSTTKGLLAPRVALTALNSASPVLSPAAGLLVYNTATAGISPYNVVPGYYGWSGMGWVSVNVPSGTAAGDMFYWNGTQWVAIQAGTNGQILTMNNGAPTWKATSEICGMPVTINHIAGAVAPVTKTTTYGTVNNIPGEPAKCWITSNLGANRQAIAVNDATEASAGWYWQFNRKQGYKYDGTTRTPNTTWITSIIETSDWITTNDPCNIELGSAWRIPTDTEWNNVNSTGGWTNWNGLWGSGLKLHAAGYLNRDDGLLSIRGFAGVYWSSTQYDDTFSWMLLVGSESSNMNLNYKPFGFSARCIREY